MKLKKKKQKKERPPQYYITSSNMQALNYKVYYMSKIEKILYFLLAFAAGAAVGYLFYGGIGKDEFGDPTSTTYLCDFLFCGVTGTIVGCIFLPMRTEQIKNKRLSNLRLQFREFLDTVSTSLGSGKTVVDALRNSYEELQVIYTENDFIIKELAIINAGLQNNINVEDLLHDFGERSGVDDIKSFADVFETCYRKGGNIRDVIKNTQQILTDKMEVGMEIETIVSGGKSEQSIMMVMPVALIGMIKMIGEDFANNFHTPIGIGATTVGIVLFITSYIVGKQVLDIKV